MPVVTVAPAGGDYATITDALAAILDASEVNPYTIQVSPGTYTEDGTAGMGLDLKDYVDIEGTDRDTVIIRSNGGGATSDAIWAVAKCSVKDCTIKAQAADHYAVHIDNLCDWFSMENVVVLHDDPAKPAIAAGGRAGQVISLTDITVSQGTFSIHGDVYSRAVTPDVWEWNLLRVTAPSLSLQDFVEYKDNKVTIENCNITAVSYSRDLTYYNANPADPLFNQDYVRRGIYLYDRGGNTIGSLTGIPLQVEGVPMAGQKFLGSQKGRVGMPFLLFVAADPKTYLDKVLALSPFAYWPLNELAGTAVADRTGHGYGGTGSAGLTYGHVGPGRWNKSVYFDGNEYVNLPLAFATAFPTSCGPQGSMCIWGKADGWVSGVKLFTFLVNAGNQVNMTKDNTNDRVVANYYAGSVNKATNETSGQTSTAWRWYCMTWDKNAGVDGEMKFYINNAQVGTTQTGLGTWSGSLATSGRVLGATDNAGGGGWLGYLSEAVLFNRVITPAERLALHGV